MTSSELDIPYIVCCILAFIPAIVLHEVGHGVAAYKLGDPTAKAAGRLSLNPINHIDPFGTVLMPLLLMLMNMPVFGYAKPVPYNPMYFKNKKLGDLIVGLAGPCANLIQFIIAAALAWILTLTINTSTSGVGYAILSNDVYQYFFGYFLYLYAIYNLYLMVFNLIPIPPLDGSSILIFFVPQKHLATYYRIQQYALPIFMIIVIVLPYAFNINPIGWLLKVTAGNLFTLVMP